MAGQASFIRIQPSEISFTFCLTVYAIWFNVYTFVEGNFFDCCKIDDIILFEQEKRLLINVISIEILWDDKLIFYFLELLYSQNICNLLFFIVNKEFNILETCKFLKSVLE